MHYSLIITLDTGRRIVERFASLAHSQLAAEHRIQYGLWQDLTLYPPHRIHLLEIQAGEGDRE